MLYISDPPPGPAPGPPPCETGSWWWLNFFLIHGIILFISWGVFAFVMIATNRYWKGWLWDKYMWIHGYLGLFVTIATLFFGIYGWYKVAWHFVPKKTKI